MANVTLSKYDFVRWAREAFVADCCKFNWYRIGDKVEVSKSVLDGKVFVHVRINCGKLPSGTYTRLPHYKSVSKLTGIDCRKVSEQALYDWHADCLAYGRECSEAELAVS